MTGPRVTVAVATYRRAHLLPRLLQALEAQTLPSEEYEVVLCDDGSDDGTAEVLAGLAAVARCRVSVVGTGENNGPATARNLAWRAGAAPIVAFTDDDCRPAPDWLERGLATLDAAGPAVVVGRTVPAEGQRHLLVDFARTIRVEDARFAQTCNVFYRRADLEAVDGFDQRFRKPVGEDTDLALRVESTGARRVFAPDAVVEHDVRPSSLHVTLRDTLRWHFIPQLYARHPGARAESLHRTWFWKPSHPPVLLLLLGLLLAPRRPAALLLALPWVHFRTAVWPVARGPRRRWALLPGALAIDTLEVAVMVGGSVRARTLVL